MPVIAAKACHPLGVEHAVAAIGAHGHSRRIARGCFGPRTTS